jgi:hypothetical protein
MNLPLNDSIKVVLLYIYYAVNIFTMAASWIHIFYCIAKIISIVIKKPFGKKYAGPKRALKILTILLIICLCLGYPQLVVTCASGNLFMIVMLHLFHWNETR